MSTYKKVKRPQDSGYISKLEEMPAAEVLVLFFIISSVIIFCFSLISFEIYISQVDLIDTHYVQPTLLNLSTVLLLLALPYTYKIMPAYENDDFGKLKKMMIILLTAGILFSIFQLLAGQQLLKQEDTVPFSTKTSYLHLFIGLHLMHLIANMIFGFVLFFQTDRASYDPVKSLLFVTNPIKKLNLRIFTISYRYITILWAILFLYVQFRF